jgi:hypothetical protein
VGGSNVGGTAVSKSTTLILRRTQLVCFHDEFHEKGLEKPVLRKFSANRADCERKSCRLGHMCEKTGEIVVVVLQHNFLLLQPSTNVRDAHKK